MIYLSEILNSDILNFTLNSALGTAFLTSVVRLTWDVVRKLEKKVEERMNLLNLKTSILLDLDRNILNWGKFYYLPVRYGTDQYIRDMANDEEKWIGRLRNEIYPLKVREVSSDKVEIQLKLKVHRRLGTQFKLFYELNSKYQNRVKEIESAFSRSGLKYSFASSPAGNRRIFFLLKEFGTVRTVDGLKNNMCFPI